MEEEKISDVFPSSTAIVTEYPCTKIQPPMTRMRSFMMLIGRVAVSSHRAGANSSEESAIAELDMLVFDLGILRRDVTRLAFVSTL